jgi:hypothetical protein
VERGLACASGRPGSRTPKEVVHPVVERVGIALDVEEEVARARLRQREQAPIRLERAVLQAAGVDQLVEGAPRVFALDLEAGCR